MALFVPLLSRDLVDRAILGRDGGELLRVVGAFLGLTLAGFALNVASGLVYTLLFILAVKILRDSPTGTT
jgi:hypothetical protein